MADLEYAVVIAKLSDEDGGGYGAFVPDLYGCTADGETESDALEAVAGAIAEWIDEARRLGRDIPAPGAAAARLAKKDRALHEIIDKQSKLLAEQHEQFDRLQGELEELRSAVECMHDENRDSIPWSVIPVIASKAREPKLPH